MKIKLAVFDLDGTVLNTLEDLYLAVNYALRLSGFPERSKAEVRSFVGNGIKRLVELSVPENTDEQNINRVLCDFNGYYAAHCADNTKPYDGITDVLSALKKSGIKTAVVSNKADYAVQALCKKYFDSLFDFAVGEREGISRKPAPDSVNEALRVLCTEKENAVYIGDSEVDIKTAQNAGMSCICVSWGFRSREKLALSGATLIVDEVSQLINELK